MPTHWESSERPLFVKTIVVNGNRHAILSQVDPLCQARKSDGSCQGYGHGGIGYLDVREEMPLRRVKSCYPSKRDISSDLQNCLVRLRVVLGTQEQKKKKDAKEEDRSDIGAHAESWKPLKKLHKRIKCTDRSDIKPGEITGFKRGNSYCSMIRTNENDDNCYPEIKMSGNCTSPATEYVPEMASKPERTNLMHNISPLNDTTEEILKNYSSYFFPIVYIKTNSSFNNVVQDARNFNNPLSERVLRWLELAQRRKEVRENQNSQTEPATQTNSENLKKFIDKIQSSKHKSEDGTKKTRSSLNGEEDVVQEVKLESDIETVLSSTLVHEYPKYSKNRSTKKIPENQNDYWMNSFLSIPEKVNSDTSITEQLKRSILDSFESIANLESVRKKSTRGISGKLARRKGLLMKLTKIRISSDEEENRDSNQKERRKKKESKRRLKCENSASNELKEGKEEASDDVRILYNEIPLSEKNSLRERGGRRVWGGEKGFNKPQLHIFMPGIDPKYLEPQGETESDEEDDSE